MSHVNGPRTIAAMKSLIFSLITGADFGKIFVRAILAPMVGHDWPMVGQWLANGVRQVGQWLANTYFAKITFFHQEQFPKNDLAKSVVEKRF